MKSKFKILLMCGSVIAICFAVLTSGQNNAASSPQGDPANSKNYKMNSQADTWKDRQPITPGQPPIPPIPVAPISMPGPLPAPPSVETTHHASPHCEKQFIPPASEPTFTKRFYIFQNGGRAGIQLNWASMPTPAQRSEAIKPVYCNGYDSQGIGPGYNSLKLNFIFQQYPNNDIGEALLSEADCWGDYECHSTYNLSRYNKLVFWVRGERGDEKIKIKAAFSAKPFGDLTERTIVYPPNSNDWELLTTDWKKCEIRVDGNDLGHVITPFSITAKSRDNRPLDTVVIYLDEIYYDEDSPEQPGCH